MSIDPVNVEAICDTCRWRGGILVSLEEGRSDNCPVCGGHSFTVYSDEGVRFNVVTSRDSFPAVYQLDSRPVLPDGTRSDGTRAEPSSK